MRNVGISVEQLFASEPRFFANESVLFAAVDACTQRVRIEINSIAKWLCLPEDKRGTPVTRDDLAVREALEDALWNLQEASRWLGKARDTAILLSKRYDAQNAEAHRGIRYFTFDDGECRELTRSEAISASGLSEVEFAASEQNEISQLRDEMDKEDYANA